MGASGASLHRHRRLPVEPVAARHAMRGGGLGRCNVAVLEARRQHDVVGPVFVDQRRIGRTRRRGADQRRQFLVIELDRGGNVLGFGAARGHGHGDRFSDMTQLAGRQYGKIRELEAGHCGAGPDSADPGKVVGDENPVFGAGRLSNCVDPCVRHRAPAERRVPHPGNLDIGDELALAMQKPRILAPRQPRAHTLIIQIASSPRWRCDGNPNDRDSRPGWQAIRQSRKWTYPEERSVGFRWPVSGSWLVCAGRAPDRPG